MPTIIEKYLLHCEINDDFSNKIILVSLHTES